MTKPNFLFLAAINGVLVVALGAFGAHALETRIHVTLLEAYRTGVQYHMFHIVALVAVHFLGREIGMTPKLALTGNLFQAGIALFSGSLYLMALTGFTWLGIITPVGGILLLIAWLRLAQTCFRLGGK